MRRAHALLTRNTRAGSRRNIAAHYDLGDDFFRLFLDETMTYSSALYEHPGQDLAAAQRAKYDRICRQLRLGPDDHVVEIGTGWGGFAIHAASTYGCRVTTTTIRGASTPRPRGGWRPPASPVGSRSAVTTTATCAASMTSWSRSR
ncbi:MAG: class I SAM-dependent methyltransferase [Kofleriaceae bacterium]|nr:class I SAM-dependent methyltransferase [Kofleriaceae bacterium]